MKGRESCCAVQSVSSSITETQYKLQQMLQELSDDSRRMGLKMYIAKTNVMVVDNTPINVNNVLI